MAGSDQHHRSSSKRRKHRRSFWDRLLGRNKYKTHRSSFPGIHFPDEKPQEHREHSIETKPDPQEGIPISKQTPSSPEKTKPVEFPIDGGQETYPRRKKSIAESIRYYFKLRAQRREIRREERFKNKMRRKHQKEYRKMESGRSLGQKLFTISAESEEARAKRIPLFSQRSEFYRSLTIMVNSLLIFVATYVLVYLFYWLTSMLVASVYGLDSTLYYYDLKFNDHSTLWNRFNILLVTGIPPFFCLFLGLFLLRVVFKHRRLIGLQKLFVLWTSFHLFNHFFGALPSGIITSEGFGYVAAWMYMNTAFKFMFSIISLFVLGLIGYYSAEKILETSDSLNRIKPENRTAFFLLQMLIPWFLGTVIMLLLRLPRGFEYPYETLMFFSMMFLVIPPFFNPRVKPRLNLLKVKKVRKINIGYLAMMLALLLFLRIVLGIGLHFMIKIDISVRLATG